MLNGWSGHLVQWGLREWMTTADGTTSLKRARERFPDARPRMITGNGPRCVARDFRDCIRIAGMPHVRTAPYSPQSNGKLERWNQTLKVTTIRPDAPDSIEDARCLVAALVTEYNIQRLHYAIGSITPADRLAGRSAQILATRDHRLEAARTARQVAHRAAAAQHHIMRNAGFHCWSTHVSHSR